LDSRVAYSRWWLERGGVRRWPAARQWQHGRRGLVCGEMPAMLGHHVHLGLKGVLGKSYGSLAFLGHERSKEFTGGANGRRRRLARLLGRAREG
jgi:hypothetical protein